MGIQTIFGIPVKGFLKFVRNIIIDPVITPDDIEPQRRILILNIILSLGILFLLPYSVIASLEGYRWLGLFDFITVCILTGTMIYLRRSKNHAAAGFITIFIFNLLLLYAISTGGVNNTAYLWSYVLPLVAMFLLGPKKGLAAVSIYLGMIIPVFFIPGTPLLFTVYSGDFKLRYITTYVAVSVVAYFAEWVRYKTQIQLEKLNIVARDTDNAVIILDARGNIQWINDSFKRIYGYTLEQFIEERGLNIVQGSSNPQIGDVIKEFFKNPKPVYYDSVHTNRSGETVWVQTTLSPVFDPRGNLINIIAVDSDITRLKQSEARIRRQNEEIIEKSKALEKVAAEARAEREAADAANRSKSEFLARMSHELRTPMNGILGFSEMLANTVLDEEQQDYSRTIKRSGETLLHLLNDILDLSKIEAGEFSLFSTEFEPGIIVSEACDIVQPRIGDKPVKLVCRISDEVPVYLKGDAGRFRQVLINLVGNAAKFTEQGEIFLNLDVEEREHDRLKLHIWVKDSGIGIPPEKLEIIFDSFQQADGYIGEHYGGTGLGLAICKQLATMMGGNVWAESTLGQGSRFHFTAWMELSQKKVLEKPGKDRPEGTAVSRVVTGDDGLPLHILLAEDNPINRKLARSIFSKAGYRLTMVENGREAVDAYTGNPGQFHLIFMDLQMPLLDGIGATEIIRKFEQSHDLRPVPIVAVTAESMKGDRERCIAAGMDDYMSKPFRQVLIFKMIEKWGSSE